MIRQLLIPLAICCVYLVAGFTAVAETSGAAELKLKPASRIGGYCT